MVVATLTPDNATYGGILDDPLARPDQGTSARSDVNERELSSESNHADWPSGGNDLFGLEDSRTNAFKEEHDEQVLGYSDELSSHETRFQKLAAAWREERGVQSSIPEIAMQPSYQQIIGMGEAAVPLLLRELNARPDHWFWALKAITGEDPVPAQKRGRVADMATAWIEWGREKGYNL